MLKIIFSDSQKSLILFLNYLDRTKSTNYADLNVKKKLFNFNSIENTVSITRNQNFGQVSNYQK